jgi:protein O-mannosyl-transferase
VPTPPSKSREVSPRTLGAALVVIVLLAYCNAFGLGAAYDGVHFVSLDQRTHAATADNLQRIVTTDYWWPQSQDRLYRPLTVLSFLFNYAVLGNEAHPLGYHAVNIALHALNVLLLFGLALRLFHRSLPAFFAAALWAVHPIGVETVANIAGRADLLATAGLLGALLVYIAWPASGRAPLGRVALLFVCALAAAAAKETGLVLIALMLLWDVLHDGLRRPDWKPRAPAYAAAAAAGALYFFARTKVLASVPWLAEPFPDNPLWGASFWTARWTAIRLLGTDLLLLIWPARLSSDRSYADIQSVSWTDAGAWLSLAVVLAIAIALLLRRKQDSTLIWAAGLFAIALLPASNLVILIGAAIAERFLYLPAAGFAIAVTALSFRFAPRKAPMILALLLAAGAARTLVRNPDWDSNGTLAAHDVNVTPRSFHHHEILAESLFWSDPSQRDRAIAELEKSWDVLKDLPPQRNLAQIPVELAFYDLTHYVTERNAPAPEAESWHARVLPLLQRADEISRAVQARADQRQLEHGQPLAPPRQNQQQYLLLGQTYQALRRYPEALDAFRFVRGLDPALPQGYEAAANLDTEIGRPDDAARLELEKTLATGSSQQALAALGQWYSRVPDGACAIVQQAGVVALNPACPAIRTDLCRALPDLALSYTDARQPARAAEFRRMASANGCQSPPSER